MNLKVFILVLEKIGVKGGGGGGGGGLALIFLRTQF